MTDWRKNATLINWIFISLFFGTLGTTLTVFDSYSWWSMIFVDLATVILSMNVASFGILVAAIVNALYFTPHNFSMKLLTLKYLFNLKYGYVAFAWKKK